MPIYVSVGEINVILNLKYQIIQCECLDKLKSPLWCEYRIYASWRQLFRNLLQLMIQHDFNVVTQEDVFKVMNSKSINLSR